MSKKRRKEQGREGRNQERTEKQRIRRKNKEYIAWKHLTRNQKEVAKKIMDGDYRLVQPGGWGFLDRFLIFLKTIGYLAVLDVDGEGYQRRMITIAKLLLTYNIKILLGISSMNQVPQLLFADTGLLMMLGYTAEQIENGHCNRGEGKKEGPMHKDTLGDALDRFSPGEMEQILNKGAKLLAKQGFLDEDEIYIQDATDIKTTELCVGCGRKTVEEEIVNKKGEKLKIGETTYGFKLMVIRSLGSRVIVAAKLVKIQESEKNYTISLLRQAIKNIGEGKVKILLIDRGYLDGETLWKIKYGFNIDFIIPARTDMQITADARGLRNITDENRIYWEENKSIKVMGIKGLTSYDQYGDEEHNKKNRNSKDFKANPINVIMVTKWKKEEYQPGKEKVFLTSLEVIHPLNVLNQYKLRSIIENTTFRELKQGWLINKIPKKTFNAVNSHVMLTLCMYSLANVYRTELGQELTDNGIRRFRLQSNKDTRSKIVVLTDEHYGIFDIEEYALLLGKPPRLFININPGKFKKEYGLE
jgi:hypothetical protein